MKEYIKRLARGSFIYEVPQLKLSEIQINKHVTVDTIMDGEFMLQADGLVKGVIYSSCERVTLIDETFSGNDNRIHYAVNAIGYHIGDVLSGSFYIVSSSGEAQIDYTFKVAEKTCATSTGEAHNMFHFANLVQNSFTEAAGIYASEDFKHVFLQDDLSAVNLYDLLAEQGNRDMSMEEFLIGMKKKSPVTISLSDTTKEYSDFTENYQDSVVVHKSTWGSITLQVKTDAEFISLKNKTVVTQDFTGNSYELEYLLNRSKMHAGVNYGKITISSFDEELTLEIIVHNHREEPVSLKHREQKEAIANLTRTYLDFRLKKMDALSWLEQSNKILDRIRGIDQENVMFKLLHAQVYVMQKRTEDGRWLLDSIKGSIYDDIEGNAELYCYYLYINTLIIKTEDYTAKVAATVRKYFEQGHDSWRMQWLLFYLDTAEEKNKSVKLARIKDACRKDCTSPVMYIEALIIMNSYPVLVRVLNSFELQVINFGCKNHMISEKLASHICSLVNNEKVASRPMLHILECLNTMYDNDEILTVLVTHLIRNELIGKKYFHLYEKGILRGLRITRLYEFYIASIDKNTMEHLPKMVLMYFAYDTQLEYQAKAYLYANIIINEQNHDEIYDMYAKQIERFGLEQMRQGRINDSLAVIYRHIWGKQLITTDTAPFMAKFLFTYKVTVFSDKIKYVVIRHKELLETMKYPVNDHVAYIQMYTDNCAIALVDESMGYHLGNVQYEIERIFNEQGLLPNIIDMAGEQIYLKLYQFENATKMKDENDQVLSLAVRLLNEVKVNNSFKRELNSWVIHYYDERYDGDDFRGRFEQIDTEHLMETDAVSLIEVCITYGMYEDAFELVERYGCDQVLPLKLFKLAKHMMEIKCFEYNKTLLHMCGHIFEFKKYDDEILQYMVLHFNGTNQQMYDLWKACANFSVEAAELAKRSIAQMLFTTEHTGRLTEIFTDYYNSGARNDVIDGYVAYNAYLYIVQQKKANDIVFKVLEDSLINDFDMPDVCKLALLKHYTEHGVQELTNEQKELAQKIIDEMCAEDKLLGFFRKLAGQVLLPYNMVDKTVVEYSANPENRVEIHYTRGEQEDSDETVEIMKCIAGGVFTKAFTLFYGESISYYITEEKNGEILRSEHFVLQNNQISPEQGQGRFDVINDMLACKEVHDMVTMRKLMRGYSVNSYVTEQIFKMM
jgi:hypothetical protein